MSGILQGITTGAQVALSELERQIERGIFLLNIHYRKTKDGIVLIDPLTGAVVRVIALQYNPDTLSRTLQVKGMGESADRSEALRLKGPPVETIKLWMLK